MATVIVNFTTKSQLFPFGTQGDKFRITIGDGVNEQSQLVDSGPVTFLGVTPGSYFAYAVRLDINGVVLNDTVVAPFEVPEPPQVGIDVVDTINVSLG